MHEGFKPLAKASPGSCRRKRVVLCVNNGDASLEFIFPLHVFMYHLYGLLLLTSR